MWNMAILRAAAYCDTRTAEVPWELIVEAAWAERRLQYARGAARRADPRVAQERARKERARRASRLAPTLVCPVCSDVFAPHDARQRYCGRRCANNSARLYPCAGCSRTFRMKRAGQRFCSKRCERRHT